MSTENQRTAYPLAWPKGWPITEPKQREHGKFKQSISSALANLKREISLMGGTGLILSSNYTLGNENPKDSGVVAYFQMEGKHVAIPCDRWTRIEQNVQALALTVEAMRGMERWGAKHMISAMFSGFRALPGTGETSGDSPWVVLGVPPTATEDELKTAYRAKAKLYHTDAPGGGNPDKFRQIQEAYDLMAQNLRK